MYFAAIFDRSQAITTNHAANKGLFVDEVRIVVTAGAGGSGCVSFRREKFVPKGGPDGGDGGDGGSVFLVADESYNTLQHLAGHHHWKAQPGVNGAGKNKSGRDGQDIYIRVPPGTIIYDDQYNVTIKDLDQVGSIVCVAKGGQGGRGNTQFKNSVNQAPRYAEPGQPGEQKHLRLELKLIADVGLVGKPNAGKSTLLSHMSKARPKIADYPFTTLYPCLGIVEMAGFRRFVMADIPGLIEGAHDGAGLGDEFLRHIERTRLLVHMIDICPLEGDPVADYRAIRKELKLYSAALARKEHVVAANKMDLTGAEEAIARFRKAVKVRVVPISAVTGKGLDKLTDVIWRQLNPSEE